MQEPGDFVMDYDLSFEAMAALGWDAQPVDWRDPDTDWNSFDVVYLCTVWDYPDHLDEFIALLQTIEQSSALLINARALVHWNMRKTYLRDLESRGADIVPTLWFAGFDGVNMAEWFAAHAAEAVVIKPEVGANAQDTFVLREPVDQDTKALLRVAFNNRAFLVQPFIANIEREGEFSLFYFAGEFSHAILKTPTQGDFRSQEEFGSSIQSVQPEAALLSAAKTIVDLVEPQPVYVRVDLIRGPDGRFLLMELELIEPSLYFRTDAGAAARFAAAIDAHYVEATQRRP